MTCKFNFKRFQNQFGKLCPCIVPNRETAIQDNICPCKDFVKDKKCVCKLFECE